MCIRDRFKASSKNPLFSHLLWAPPGGSNVQWTGVVLVKTGLFGSGDRATRTTAIVPVLGSFPMLPTDSIPTWGKFLKSLYEVSIILAPKPDKDTTKKVKYMLTPLINTDAKNPQQKY